MARRHAPKLQPSQARKTAVRKAIVLQERARQEKKKNRKGNGIRMRKVWLRSRQQLQKSGRKSRLRHTKRTRWRKKPFRKNTTRTKGHPLRRRRKRKRRR